MDLIVIYDPAAPFMARLDALYTALQLRLAVDLLAYTPHEWEQMQTSAFVRRALAKGQAIYEYLLSLWRWPSWSKPAGALRQAQSAASPSNYIYEA